jgi:CheY-like chemotaxis protein/HPt (histidine-containing phosphotransfer) domain-containing protein
MTGGTVNRYRRVLSMFCKDVKERLRLLRFFLFESTMSGNKLPEKHLPLFTTQVHTLKSVTASLGAPEISTEAGLLEEAGKAGERVLICENLGGFIEHLAELAENINAALKSLPDGLAKTGESEPMENGLSACLPLFAGLSKALKTQNLKDIDNILDELNRIPQDQKTKEILELISDQVLMTEFESAAKVIDELTNGNNQYQGMNMECSKQLIILVDDNPANLIIGKNVLSEKYIAATAPSSAKLFKLLENNRPVLILLDGDMPDMNGYKAIELLKSKQETKDIPVIFLTGMTEPREEEKGRSLGAVDYIKKPFDPPALIASIEKYC